jgi:hypothetical protein
VSTKAGQAQTGGVNIVILRYFSVYWPRQRPDMGFCKFCRPAIQELVEVGPNRSGYRVSSAHRCIGRTQTLLSQEQHLAWAEEGPDTSQRSEAGII